MKEIVLKTGEVATVDDEDYQRVTAHRWYRLIAGKATRKIYAQSTAGTMHRLIMGYPTRKIDHKDGNGLNNQRQNLRLATDIQNARNRRKQSSPSSSRYKGVGFNKRTGKWRADIGDGGRVITIGYFTDEIAAARAYDDRAIRLHGEFACLNFQRV